jgi:hypothetical protein
LDRSVRHVAVRLLAATGGLAEQDPVGRQLAGPAESFGIHECPHEVNQMPIHPLPIVGDARPIRPSIWDARCSTRTQGRIRKRRCRRGSGCVPSPSVGAPSEVGVARTDAAAHSTRRYTGDGRPCAHARYFRCSPTRCSSRDSDALSQAVHQWLLLCTE